MACLRFRSRVNRSLDSGQRGGGLRIAAAGERSKPVAEPRGYNHETRGDRPAEQRGSAGRSVAPGHFPRGIANDRFVDEAAFLAVGAEQCSIADHVHQTRYAAGEPVHLLQTGRDPLSPPRPDVVLPTNVQRVIVVVLK